MSKWNWELEDGEFVSKYIAKYLKISSCSDCWITHQFDLLKYGQAAYADVLSGSLSPDEIGVPGVGSPPTPDIGLPTCMCAQDGPYPTDPDTCFELALKGESVPSDCNQHLDFCAECGFTCGHNPGCEPYLEMLKNPPSFTLKETPERTYAGNNGSIFGFAKNKTDKVLYIYTDINGSSLPNRYNEDKFIFTVNNGIVTRMSEYNF